MMIFTTGDGHPAPLAIHERTAEDKRLATHAREIINMRSELTKISDHLIRAGGSDNPAGFPDLTSK
ncbi:hypothetical protein M8J71_03155 [Pseudarthrobacter sp. R1]|uniref:hypothetical protein n=1 Tax=Pseudarthrobacter sp. R1 TaxID=2944934 RepID=UPI00210CC8F0|nr:hypothetical protein [Pseudarthrobacter sp. R1]MCQ6269486.1 hypothetical protein [Pseudarthrobacter sp. R1]